MQHAQRKALETYKENLAYLAQHHKSLYDRLILLETAISNEIYPEHYILEYKNEGYFDVLEVESGEYLYGENSLHHAQKIIESMDFTRTNGIFEAQRFVDFSPEMPDIVDQSKLHINNGVWATIKIIEYAKKVAARDSTQMKVVYKALFLGVGLGLHIPNTVKKMGSKIIFIREQNLELFRLALFVTNFSRLSKQAKLFFSIMEDELANKQIFLNFLDTGNNYNLYMKQMSLTKAYEEELFLYQNYVMAQDYIMYPYSAYLLRFIDSPRYVAGGYPFLKISRESHSQFLSEKPVLLLLAGPSMAKNIEWIQQNQKRFIIVTALAACKYLHKHDIKPHIVIHIDPAEEEGLYMLEGIDKNFFDDVLCLFSGNVHPRLTERFQRDQLYFIQQATNYKYEFGSFSSVTVGEYSYALSLIFGVKELYLLGMDLALDPETLASHSPGHHHFEIAQRDAETTSIDKILIDVPGNLIPVVPTNASFKLAIQEFERMSQLFKSDQKVYNLSNGAYLAGAEPMYAAKVPVNNFRELDSGMIRESLKTFFDSIASGEFREEDKELIRYQLQEARRLRGIIEKFKKSTYAMPSLYIDALAKLNHQLSDMEKKTNSDLAEVYYFYFKIVLSYICEIFNTQNLIHTKDHIKGINTILIMQLEKIANSFISAMEGYLSEIKD